jgi:hypothetical protein
LINTRWKRDMKRLSSTWTQSTVLYMKNKLFKRMEFIFWSLSLTSGGFGRLILIFIEVVHCHDNCRVYYSRWIKIVTRNFRYQRGNDCVLWLQHIVAMKCLTTMKVHNTLISIL